jgi:hypothetical protein
VILARGEPLRLDLALPAGALTRHRLGVSVRRRRRKAL